MSRDQTDTGTVTQTVETGGLVGITLGDPSGIGPEIIAASLAALATQTPALLERIVIFGARDIVARAAQAGGTPLSVHVAFEEIGCGAADIEPGKPGRASSFAQIQYLEAAATAARDRRIAALVTGPISKHHARTAGFAFPGHTEFLAARAGVGDVAMMFAGPRLNVVLATVHMAVSQVSAALSLGLLQRRISMAAETMSRDFGMAHPRVGVVGLNPHAGEGGLFGAEEQRIIAPAIELAAAALGEAATVSGPLVPDAAFREALDGAYDVVVAMYHDQGLIPVKLVDFDEAVNVTLGLPFIRTSPDHGTAFDIAGRGIARSTSFEAALRLAFRLLDGRLGSAGSTDAGSTDAGSTDGR